MERKTKRPIQMAGLFMLLSLKKKCNPKEMTATQYPKSYPFDFNTAYLGLHFNVT